MKRQPTKVGTAHRARMCEHRREVETVARNARQWLATDRACQDPAIAVAVDPPAFNEITQFHR